MGYVPPEILALHMPESADSPMAPGRQNAAVFRRLKTVNAWFSDDGHWLSFSVEGVEKPLAIERARLMRFDKETVTAAAYCKLVLEQGDLIDAVLEPEQPDYIPIRIYWIHIQYEGTTAEARRFSKKEDGDFALRTKSGEKAERVVARDLRDRCGHVFPPRKLQPPGYFKIWYLDKGNRAPDLICESCGLVVEVKKRNRDRRYRVSHSRWRSFTSENRDNGWHAFVFADMKPRYVPNAQIARAFQNSQSSNSRDGHDTWTDIEPSAISEQPPPPCRLRAGLGGQVV